MNGQTIVALYSVAIVAGSLFGGWLPSVIRLNHIRLQLMLSFVGGTMLGVGVLHMLPHAVIETGSLERTLDWTLFGLLGMFLLIRTFHFHEHGAVDEGDHSEHGHSHATHEHHHPHQDHAADGLKLAEGHAVTGCSHSVAGHASPNSQGASWSWFGVAIGLSLHSFLDGVALAAGVMADQGTGNGWQVPGIGVFLAILLHKPLDALSITTLMQAGNWSRNTQQVINAGFAMMCPLGALLFIGAIPFVDIPRHDVVGIALAVTAGIFLCISLSDLLPEVQFHRHDRFKLSASLLLGVACAYAMRWAEPPHAHAPRHSATQESSAAVGEILSGD